MHGEHFQDDDEHHHQLNSRTIKEFPEDTGTLVPEKDNLDGTMIAHTDCGTLVPDSGTMVELESNLGTMVINSDSEDSTMKSKSGSHGIWQRKLCHNFLFVFNLYRT